MSPKAGRNPLLPHDEERVLAALRVSPLGASGADVSDLMQTDRVYVDAILLGLARRGAVHVTPAGRWRHGRAPSVEAALRTRLAYEMCTLETLARAAGKPPAAVRTWLEEHRWVSACRVGDVVYWHGPLTAVHVMHYMRHLGAASSVDVAGAFGVTEATATQMLESLCARTEYAPVRLASIRAS